MRDNKKIKQQKDKGKTLLLYSFSLPADSTRKQKCLISL